MRTRVRLPTAPLFMRQLSKAEADRLIKKWSKVLDCSKENFDNLTDKEKLACTVILESEETIVNRNEIGRFEISGA